MLDTETLGVRPGCVIRSIGLIRFDFDGSSDLACYWNVEESSQIAAGLTIDPATASYWLRQPAASRDVFKTNPLPLERVLYELTGAIGDHKPVLWADGATFDFPILTAAYEALGQQTPWRAPQLRCARTILNTFDFDARDMPPPREPRTAMTRALFQAQCLVTCLRQIAQPPKRSVFE
ncbi:exonuclease [EBPR siphovirus 2]|nr:exonuclease [EBPR siphovirus 2]